jgi:hypothetical protein
MVIEDEAFKPPKSLEELTSFCVSVLQASRLMTSLTGTVKNVAIVIGDKVAFSVPADPADNETVQGLKAAARKLGCIIYILSAYTGGSLGSDYALLVLGYTPSFKIHLRNILKADSNGRVVEIAPKYDVGEAEGAGFLDPWQNERVTGVIQ